MNFKPVLNNLWKWTKRNSTKLLAAGAITAEALGFWFMHKEAPVVRDRLEELGPDAKWYEKVKVAAPVYWPAVLMFLMSSGCVIGGLKVGEKKAAIMASLYSASEASIRRLEEKMAEKLGPEKAKELHDKASEELANSTPPEPNNIKETGKGNDLFFERKTGQWFRSSYNAVMNDVNTFNKYLIDGCKMLDFNEWLDCLGAERAEFGDMFGFGPDWRLNVVITGDCKLSDGQLYYILDYTQGHDYGPVMYNGKRGVEFRQIDDCFPPSY